MTAGDERGSATLLIIGFAVVLLLAIAWSSTPARRSCSARASTPSPTAPRCTAPTSAPQGGEVYTGGLGDAPLELTQAQARAAVRAYLASVGAYRDLPRPDLDVAVDGDRSRRHLTAPLDLPLTVPGGPHTTLVSAKAVRSSILTERLMALSAADQ